MSASRIGIMVSLSLLLHLVVMKVPLPQQQNEVEESLELVEPVPIKVEREEPILDIATAPIPAEPKTKPEPPQTPKSTSPAPTATTPAPPRPDQQLETEIETAPATNQQPATTEVETDPESGDEAPFEYDQAGFAILDESLHLEGSTAGCGGNHEGCREVGKNIGQAADDLEALFASQGYDFEALQIADDTGLKAYELTSRDNPAVKQYLHVFSGGLGRTFYVVAPERLTLDQLNEKLNST